MIWITLNIVALVGIAAVLAVRLHRRQDDPSTPAIQPPRVYPNLPEAEMVNIRALFDKWGD